MTENPHDLQQATPATGWRGLACLAALAAVTLAGCSTSAGSTAVHAPSGTPAPSTSTSAPMPIATQDSTPTVTVTVTPPPPPTPTVVQSAASGPFRSPSGNINCNMFTMGGQNVARCEVVAHTWVAPPRSPDCHLDWGDRFHLTQGDGAGFNCYGQEFPAPEQTLGYGQTRSLGTITCDSEYTGMTCTDSSTGHYFRVSRNDYELG